MTRPRALAALLCVALISALAGPPAFSAAKKLVTSKQIKNGTIKTKDISKKARAALRGQTGAQGPVGPTGPAGPAGNPATADGSDRQFALLFSSGGTCETAFPVGESDGVNCGSVIPATTGQGLEIRDVRVEISSDDPAEEITVGIFQFDDSFTPTVGAGCVVPPGELRCTGAGASFDPNRLFTLVVFSEIDNPIPSATVSWDTYRPGAAPPLTGPPLTIASAAKRRIRAEGWR